MNPEVVISKSLLCIYWKDTGILGGFKSKPGMRAKVYCYKAASSDREKEVTNFVFIMIGSFSAVIGYTY